MLIVGIDNGRNRARDLTPERFTGADSLRGGGGGDRFLDYVTQEVLPSVRERYRAAPYTVFAGHSFGGLLAVHVAATRPTLAHAVIAMSPSLWVNGQSATPRFVSGIAGRVTPLRFFSTRGGFEPNIDTTAAQFVRQLGTALRARPNPAVAVADVRYADASHDLTPLSSLVDGVRWVFKDYSLAEATMVMPRASSGLDSAGVERAIRAAEAVYARAEAAFPSSLMGTIARPSGVMPVQGYLSSVPAIVALRQFGAGINILSRAVAAYPSDPRTHWALGTVRLARGDTTAAIGDLERASALSQTPDLASFKARLEAQLTALRR